MGVTKRWLISSSGIVAVILILLAAGVSVVAMSYYYSGIEQTLRGHALGYENYSCEYRSSESIFIAVSRNYVEDFQYKEQMELILFNSDDNVVITSSGFNAQAEGMTKPLEYAQAKTDGNLSAWIGRIQTDEKVMSIVKTVYSSSGTYLGAMCYIVSLEKADYQVFFVTVMLILISVFVGIIAMLANAYFIRGIVKSVENVSLAAKKIAQGKFESRIEKKYDDEIGELCDSVNFMARELGESEKMKNDFISSVSHELRTPLTAINGWAETMKLSELTDKNTMNKGLNIIIKETGRLSGLVEELLDFSRMQNNKMVLMLEKMDILAELDEAVYMYNERALAEGKHLVFEAPETVSPILGDKNRLKQVFANLIDNSLKYTPENGVITVSVEEENDKVYIMIRDNGCGISAEHLPKITEKFYKVNNTQRGSGIGLAVVDEIIRLHSGTLNIESTEGEGTTVVISLATLKNDDLT